MGGQLETCSLLPAHADVYDAVINDHSVAMRATEFKEPQVRLHWSAALNPGEATLVSHIQSGTRDASGHGPDALVQPSAVLTLYRELPDVGVGDSCEDHGNRRHVRGATSQVRDAHSTSGG